MYMGIGIGCKSPGEVLQIEIAPGYGDKFLETDNIRILGTDMVHDPFPCGCIMLPMIVVEKPHVIGKDADGIFYLHCRGMPETKLDELAEGIPSQRNAKK
jgi:hypothetical protein